MVNDEQIAKTKKIFCFLESRKKLPGIKNNKLNLTCKNKENTK